MNLEYYEQYIKNTLGIPNVNFEGVDIDTVKEITEALKFILNKYHALKKTICSIGSSEDINNQMNLLNFADNPQAEWEDKEDDSNNYMSTCTLRTPKQTIFKFINIPPITEFVGLSYATIFKDLEYGVILESIDKHSHYRTKFTANIKGIIYHEMGHVLDTILGISDSEELYKILSHKKWNILSELDIASCISIKELVAEAFAEYISNPEPSELVYLIGSLIDKKYNEKKDSWIFEVNYRYKKHLERADKEINKRSR